MLLIIPAALIAQNNINLKEAEKLEGYFDFYWNEDKGEIYLSVDKLNQEFLYVNSLTAGIGSNDIGLDRGQLGGTQIVYFEKRGPKILLIQPNYDYRAKTDNELERKSVREAFATSVLWGFKIEQEDDGAYLINLTDFLMNDAHGVSDRLRAQGEGNFSIDKSRSALYREGTFNFPKNSEFEAMLTFKGRPTGRYLRSVAPNGESFTVRQHHSFIELPDDGYEPRKHDPRGGFFGISYQDYGTPIDESLVKRFISRHRLQKKNPEAAVSEVVEPIVYYLDNGTPEPVRSALLDGARWWAQAFEDAGFKDAYRVEIMPEDAHPMDVRYNVIQWVHRSTRGWSYGASVTDPRTGEIIKGHVSLGSLRVRQDFLIAEGLLAPYKNGNEEDPRMMEMALARIRQLSAHEVGHTLGLAHNFAASTYGRESVMDYPHPTVRLDENGEIDLSDAYDTGIGEWDKVAIAFGYQDFPEGTDEEAELNKLLEQAHSEGYRYITDQDARPQGGAHPKAHLWDNGADAVAELERVMSIRKKALNDFSEANIRTGRSMSELEDVLVPVYLFHRYQVEAAVKLIGGVDYNYKMRGDNQPGPEILPAKVQATATNSLLKTIKPEHLAMPESVLQTIPPRAAGIGSSRELFRGNTGPTLDPLGIAHTTADFIFGLMLHPQRANRLVEQSSLDDKNYSLDDLLDAIFKATWDEKPGDDYHGAIQVMANYAALNNLIKLSMSDAAHPAVKSNVLKRLKDLKANLMPGTFRDDGVYAEMLLTQFFEHPGDFEGMEVLPAPPGSPIGSDKPEFCSYN
jgi:hypothetical protein